MKDVETINLSVVRSYLSALQSGVAGAALAAYSSDDALQIEFPNALNPKGGRSDLATLLQRSEQGQKLLQRQQYEIVSILAQGSQVAVEARWSAVLAAPVGRLDAGATMQAHFAMFFELVDGRISRQHNYDCFEPW